MSARQGQGSQEDKPASTDEKAAQLLEAAKAAIESKSFTLARLRLQSIVREYATKPAAKEAEKLLKSPPK